MSDGDVPVRITSFRGEAATGMIRLGRFATATRLWRAVKIELIFLIFAGAAVFLPGIHFVLVPALLIAGPVFASRVFGQVDAVLGGDGTCPDCHATFAIRTAAYRDGLHQSCPHCRTQLHIQP